MVGKELGGRTGERLPLVNPLDVMIEVYNNSGHVFLQHPEESSILWTITNRCNQRCVYCYETIHQGYSEIDIDTEKRIIEYIKEQNIENVHISGGEIFLYPRIWEVIEELQDHCKLYLSTNLSLCSDVFWKKIKKVKIFSIGVSIDSLNINTNDMLRDNSEVVINNLKRLIYEKKSCDLKFLTKIHIVITKLNLGDVIELIEWSRQEGIDSVVSQPVTLSKNHEYYEQLNLMKLDEEQIKLITKCYEIEQEYFNNGYSEVTSSVIQLNAKNSDMSVKNCIEKTARYISYDGKLYSCPCQTQLIYDFKAQKRHNESFPEKCKFTMQCLTNLKHCSKC